MSTSNSKTPKFDAALDAILEKLVPETRTCLWTGKHQYCEGDFKIEDEDIEFLKMLRVPPPNYCPTCRRIRRLVHMGHGRFFKHACNAPGHTEMMISVLPEECPFPVYDYKYYLGDEFDPFVFGMNYEPGADPLETLYALRQKAPMPSFLNRDPSCINSEYSNGGRDLKNGYYVSGCFSAEDVWYSSFVYKSRQIMDSRAIRNSDQVYKGLYSDHIYKSSFIYFSLNCTESMFLFDCRNCSDSFGCVNLRNAQRCIFNEKVTKEEYESFKKGLENISRAQLREYEKRFWELVRQAPVNASRNLAVEQATGVLLDHSRNVFDANEATNSEQLRHVDGAISHKGSMDLLFSGGNSSNLYGTINVGSQANRVRFSVSSKYCTDSEFIFNCKNSSNCFMCFGLQNKSYCILNTQYEPEEYFSIVDAIKIDMLERGQYSDGLPMQFSAQAYNFSLAAIGYPLPDEEVMALGGYVGHESETNVGAMQVLKTEEVPETIAEVGDDILTTAITCEITGRPFRIIATELEFYRAMKLPLPLVHPTMRILAHYQMAPVGKRYVASCVKCGKDIDSLFGPDKNFILYCESCYQQEVM